MKIAKIRTFEVENTFKEGQSFLCSFNLKGTRVPKLISTIVEITTSDGTLGYGEVCPFNYYIDAYHGGVGAGIKEIGPCLIGDNPLEIKKLNDKMDDILQGHSYTKSAIDIALWDILGKVTGQPVCMLLGGRYGDSVELCQYLSQEDPDLMVSKLKKYKANGCRRFKLKVGSEPLEDIKIIRLVRANLDPDDVLVVDSNCHWLPHEALRIANETADIDMYFEQPCSTYEEIQFLRQHTNKPIILDETSKSLHAILRAYQDKGADGCNLKLSKFGGITRAKQAIDLCASIGMFATIEDSWGGEIVSAAISHVAHSTPEKCRFLVCEYSGYNANKFADGAPEVVNNRIKASEKPGLGIEPRMDMLGGPILVIE